MDHYIKKISLVSPLPDGFKEIILGAGCFWGVEKKFYDLPGVYLTSTGYCGGLTKNPSYEEVCSGETGHAEVIKVIYDPELIDFEDLLIVFWECHDPTQGMRQGNDIGTQYRSLIVCSSEKDVEVAKISKEKYQSVLRDNRFGEITTEILKNKEYFLAEEYHQQYLAKNPNGYCGIGGTNCSFPKE